MLSLARTSSVLGVSSVTAWVSLVTVGRSLTGVTITVTVAVDVNPPVARSLIVYVNVAVPLKLRFGVNRHGPTFGVVLGHVMVPFGDVPTAMIRSASPSLSVSPA